MFYSSLISLFRLKNLIVWNSFYTFWKINFFSCTHTFQILQTLHLRPFPFLFPKETAAPFQKFDCQFLQLSLQGRRTYLVVLLPSVGIPKLALH